MKMVPLHRFLLLLMILIIISTSSFRSHAICQLKILKERIGNDSGSTQASPPLYVQTPELDDEDEFFDSHDQLGQSIVSSIFCYFSEFQLNGL